MRGRRVGRNKPATGFSCGRFLSRWAIPFLLLAWVGVWMCAYTFLYRPHSEDKHKAHMSKDELFPEGSVDDRGGVSGEQQQQQQQPNQPDIDQQVQQEKERENERAREQVALIQAEAAKQSVVVAKVTPEPGPPVVRAKSGVDNDRFIEFLPVEQQLKEKLRPSITQSLKLMSRVGHKQRLKKTIGYGSQVIESQAKKHDTSRDYRTKPIKLERVQDRRADKRGPDQDYKCSVPCKATFESKFDATFTFSMENRLPPMISEYWGNTELDSPIPVPYFSYAEYEFTKKAPGWDERSEAVNKSMAMVMISNCGPEERLEMVRRLEKHGVTIDKYGSCFENEFGGRKIDLLRQYRFYLAFENSPGKDYVTEKLLQPFVTGIVPVYMHGAFEPHFFAPDTGPYPYTSKAVISVSDFEKAEDLANVIIESNNNRELWEERQSFKTRGFSLDFQATVDLSLRHSMCRACIAVGDALRRKFGPSVYDKPTPGNTTELISPAAKTVLVRERGNYVFTRTHLRETTLESLVTSILLDCVPWPKNRRGSAVGLQPGPLSVYGIYTHPHKGVVLSDEDVAALPEEAELEFIYV